MDQGLKFGQIHDILNHLSMDFLNCRWKYSIFNLETSLKNWLEKFHFYKVHIFIDKYKLFYRLFLLVCFFKVFQMY